jgi:hypothetical protein
VFVDRVVARAVFGDCVLTMGGGAAWGEGVFGVGGRVFVG